MAFPINLTSGIVFLRNLLAGGGTGTYVPSGVVNANTTPVSNVGTAETDLMTYSLPANSLNVNGRGVRVTAWGTNAANADNKTIKVYFGATVVGTLALSTANGSAWWVQATILRSGATAQVAIGMVGQGNLTPVPIATSPAETLSGAVTVKATGTSGTGSNDITQTGMLVEVLP